MSPQAAGIESIVATRENLSRSLDKVLQQLTQPAEDCPPITKTQGRKDGEKGMLPESARTEVKSSRTVIKILILA
jgi:hypothetical protein